MDGVVCDGMKGQRHELIFQVVLVDITQQSLMGKLEDGLDEMTAGRVFQKHQKWTDGGEINKKLGLFFTQINKLCRDILSHLTPGAELSDVRYPMMHLLSFLHSMGLFL